MSVQIARRIRKAEEAAPHIKRKLLGAGCMAVGLYTFKHQPGRASEFWNALCENDGLRKHDPRATLMVDFMNRQYNVGSVRQTVQAPVLAWNAWNEKRELKIIKCLEDAKICVWGTPLANGAKQ